MFGCYLKQSSTNKTAQAISAAESQYKKQKAGAETSTVVLKQPAQDKEPILKEIATLATQKESKAQSKKVEIDFDSLKRKLDLLQKRHDTEKSKRKKLEKQLKGFQAPEEGATIVNTPTQESFQPPPASNHQPAPKTNHPNPKSTHSRKTPFRTAAGRPIHHNRGGSLGGRAGGRNQGNSYNRTNEQAGGAPNGRGGRGRGGRGRDSRPPLTGRGRNYYQKHSSGRH